MPIARILDKLPLCYKCGKMMRLQTGSGYDWSGRIIEDTLYCNNYEGHFNNEKVSVSFHTHKWRENIWNQTVRKRNKGHIVTS